MEGPGIRESLTGEKENSEEKNTHGYICVCGRVVEDRWMFCTVSSA